MSIVTIAFEAGAFPLTQVTLSASTFRDLFHVILPAMGEDFNPERIMFYDREYRRIHFHSDDDPVPHSFLHVIIINDNVVGIAFDERYTEQTATWPWSLTEEEVEEYITHRNQYD